MNVLLVLAFLFFIGALLGWGMEFLFRNLISHSGKRGRFFINPGFCRGPYLPIYGVGLTVLFLIAYLETQGIVPDTVKNKILLFVSMAVTMTLIEFIGGYFLLKVLNIRLWDYSDRPGNVMGLICPLFSMIWAVIGAVYYWLVHPHIINALIWLSNNLAFSFFIGLFFGVFSIDLVSSFKDAATIKKFGDENKIIIRYEELKALVLEKMEKEQKKFRFFAQARGDEGLLASLRRHVEARIPKKDKK